MTDSITPKWGRFEREFASSLSYDNSFQDVDLKVNFVSPSGRHFDIDGFWDGDNLWRVRFSPDEIGAWRYSTVCSDTGNPALHNQSGGFTCTEPDATTPFREHGPVRLSANRRHLVYEDGTPYLWLADTAWNGPLWASDEDWEHYLSERTRQNFTAVQWVTTQWLAAPQGDANNDLAYAGHERISVNPAFFQRLDRRHEKINQYGLLSAPVLLWTAGWTRGESDLLSPGFTLPEDQAVRLGRYMLARWGADTVLWILAGDGDYRGSKAERWKRIGRAIFGNQPHAPVTLHPQGLQWNMAEFQDETWLDIAGYQSCHWDNQDAYGWLVEGPPATDWVRSPARPIINLEPNYEDIGAIDTKRRFSDFDVRRAIYRSLLVAPTAGVTYGAHGVWDWSDGRRAAVGHEGFGIPHPWREGLQFLGARQMRHLHQFFTSIEWWRLVPAPDMVPNQPIPADKSRFVVASRTETGDMGLVYLPDVPALELDTRSLAASLCMEWLNARTGEMTEGVMEIQRIINLKIVPPGDGDWLVWFHQAN